MFGLEMMVVCFEQVGGWLWCVVINVDMLIMIVYLLKGCNIGVVVVVFFGGGFEVLVIDLEGSEICDWLIVCGIICVLFKYCVFSVIYDWYCCCCLYNFVLFVLLLQDVQCMLWLVCFYVCDWYVDLYCVGVIGFLVGGYLVVEVSINYCKMFYLVMDIVDCESVWLDFVLVIYFGYLICGDGKFNCNVFVIVDMLFIFILQVSDDDVDGVQQVLIYYVVLQVVKVLMELYIYVYGGYVFGLCCIGELIIVWIDLVDIWLCMIGISIY